MEKKSANSPTNPPSEARRNKLANQLTDSVMAIHAYWMPLRIAVHERTVAKAM